MKKLLLCLAAVLSAYAEDPSHSTEVLQNDGSTGTTINKLASKSSAGLAIITPISATSGVIGVCVNNCSTAGEAIIKKAGKMPIGLAADGTVVAGHLIGVSASVAGDGTDAGASCPATGAYGFWLQAGTGAGTYSAFIDFTVCPPVAGVGTVTSSGPPVGGQIAAFTSATDISTATATHLAKTVFGTGGGTAQAQTVTLSPAVTTLTSATGLRVCWVPAAANTAAAPNLSVSGLTNKAITKNGTAALVANDIITTKIACAQYDGTQFQLDNPATTVPPTTNQNIREINGGFDGGGIALSGTMTRCRNVAFAGTIQQITLSSDVAGAGASNNQVDFQTVAYASYTGPASAATITGSGTIPKIGTGVKYQDATFTSWGSLSLSANTMVCAVLTSPSGATWITYNIKVAAN